MTKSPAIKKYQKKFEHSYTYGVYPTVELIKNRPQDVISVYISPKAMDGEGLQLIRSLCAKHKIFVVNNSSLVEKTSGMKNAYVLGVFSKYTSKINLNSNHLILVNPTDMGNLGTITRTMAAFGFNDLAIITPCADIFDPKVIRTSMGSLFSINFEMFESLDKYHEKNKQRNVYLFTTDGKTDLNDLKVKTPFSLIFGNESTGLLEHHKKIGKTVFIKQSDKVDSLNLAISVGLGLYKTETP